jgi:hypothetical protein
MVSQTAVSSYVYTLETASYGGSNVARYIVFYIGRSECVARG